MHFMAVITIKNIPPSLHEKLKDRARRRGRSLNRELIHSLQELVESQPVDVKQMVEQLRNQRKALPGKLTDELLEKARREGRP